MPTIRLVPAGEQPQQPDDHYALDDGDCPGADDGVHDWRPIWSTNGAGRAYRCEHCWDRTD